MPTTHNMTDYVSLTVSSDDGTTLSWTSVGSSTSNLNFVDQNDDGDIDIAVDTAGSIYVYTGYTVTVGANTYGVFKFNTTYLIPYNSGLEDLRTIFPSSGSTSTIVDNAQLANCFLTGTLIATPNGEVAVETISPGDMVMTAEGRAVPVRFLFRQNVVNTPWISAHMEPVRISAGALGDGLPRTDLTVSADHGMILDGLVINASALVNGRTIRFVPLSEMPAKFSYWHIETEAHDVILANGAPSETFLDAAGRVAFDNHGEYLSLYGVERIIPELQMPRIASARLLPQAIRDRLGQAPMRKTA